jgi:hypothetical protein
MEMLELTDVVAVCVRQCSFRTSARNGASKSPIIHRDKEIHIIT